MDEIGVELAERLKLDVRTLAPEKQREAAKKWLTERRSLLVLDDVWHDDARELVPGPAASVLVTSRERSLRWVPRGQSREVEKFTPDEAELRRIIHDAGYLPAQRDSLYRTYSLK